MRNVMNPERAAKIAANKIGVSVEEYQERRAGGAKWCWGCQEWHRLDAFNADRSRRDGMARICRKAHNHRYPHARPPMSLSAPVTFWYVDRPTALVEYVPDQDTIIDIGEVEAAERLYQIVGDMDPDDVRFLDENSLQRLQDRLRAEGLVPHTVQKSERERLRMPDAHSGGSIQKSKSRGSRRTRKQRMAHHAATHRTKRALPKATKREAGRFRRERQEKERERDE